MRISKQTFLFPKYIEFYLYENHKNLKILTLLTELNCFLTSETKVDLLSSLLVICRH